MWFKAAEAASRTCFLIPHFLFFRLIAFPPAGAVDKLLLPEGMRDVNFENCYRLTGTLGVRTSDGHIYLIRLAASRTRFLIPHFYPFCTFSSFRLPFRRGHRPDEPPRGHAVRELQSVRAPHRYG